jgi:two-component sensor histidine kinase
MKPLLKSVPTEPSAEHTNVRRLSDKPADTEARLRAELAERDLEIRQLNHSMKNQFAVIASMVMMTGRRAVDTTSMSLAIRGRIQALSTAHDVNRSECADIAALFSALVGPSTGGEAERLAVDGPPLSPSSAAITDLAMVVHELATNASRYGALSEPVGRVSVGWQKQADSVQFQWVESGGPKIGGAPERNGFGLKLISQVIELQFKGTLEAAWPEQGFCATFTIPNDSLGI